MRAVLAVALALSSFAAQAQNSRTSHGLSLFGDLKYPADFTHFDYVNPVAPKGGLVRMEATGTFDTLNPFVIKGNSATGLGLMYDSLLESARDEASAEYGLLVERAEVAEDLSWVGFDLRSGARWHDGQEVTANDVVFSFDLLKAKGAPFYRFYYANVAEARAEGPHRVRFSFKGRKNR
ncbi:MAG: ABC transporter substrate-binding protein, partial [Alphaproteobacteria bacterium]|nr:ABC transporter substrate-binding protein [Alphaproteobacteria bacterium]